MFKHKLWSALSIMLLIAFFVSACAAPQATNNPPATTAVVVTNPTTPPVISNPTTPPMQPTTPAVEQVLKVAIASDPGPLNPHDLVSQFVALNMIYEPLVNYEANGKIVPGLAKSWEISPDGITYTFHLREGVVFQDGTPFNAAAVKWNMDRWLADELWSGNPYWHKIIRETIQAPDEYTVTFKLNEPYFATLQELTFTRPSRMLSPSSVDANGKYVKPVGTGSWKLEEYVPDQRMVFVPFENYWGEKPKLSKVILEVIPDAQARVNALLSGEVGLIGGDYIGGIPLESIPLLKQNPNVNVVTGQGGSTYVIGMNFLKPPFNDENIRRAVNYAIDRNIIAEKLFSGLVTPAQGVFPPSVPYVTYKNPQLYTYALDKAKDLLKQAGWKTGNDGILEKDGKKFETEYIVDGGAFPQSKSLAEVVQAQLREVGIDVKIRLVDYGAWSAAIQQADYGLSTWLTYGPPYDPQSGVSMLFRYAILGAGDDGTVYGDPTLDSLEDTTLRTTTEEDRQAAFDKIWEYMDVHSVCAPIVFSVRTFAVDSHVKGFNLPTTEYALDLNTISIEAK